MARPSVTYVAATLLLLAASVPASAQDAPLEGIFKLEGRDTTGAYKGDWTIGPVASGLAVEADLTYASGIRELRRGLGTMNGNELVVQYDSVTRPATPGIIGALYGEHTEQPQTPSQLMGTYLASAGGSANVTRTLKGVLTWVDVAGVTSRFGAETCTQIKSKGELRLEYAIPNIFPRPSVFPIPVKLRGKGFPTNRKVRLDEIKFEDPGLVAKEILDQNPFGTEITVSVDVTPEARLGRVKARVAGSPIADIAAVADVTRHIFVCLADGSTNGEPFDEYEGDKGVEAWLRGGPKPATAVSKGPHGSTSDSNAKKKAKGLSKEFDGYQVVEAAKYDTFVVLNKKKLFLVKFVWNKAELTKAFGTKDAAVVIDGHGHYGTGPTFNPPASPDEKFTMDATTNPSADLLTNPIRMTDFFYNGCWSGAFFTSTMRAVMPTGRFFYCRMMANAWWTSREFVRGIIEERKPEATVKAMMQHNDNHEVGIAGFVRCADPVGPDDPDNTTRTLLSVTEPSPNSEMAPRIFTAPVGWVRPE